MRGVVAVAEEWGGLHHFCKSTPYSSTVFRKKNTTLSINSCSYPSTCTVHTQVRRCRGATACSGSVTSDPRLSRATAILASAVCPDARCSGKSFEQISRCSFKLIARTGTYICLARDYGNEVNLCRLLCTRLKS